ncbi:DUF2878 domain-containing protein [Shewanella sp. 202IG2-18]|uniref:DUF2878 domain-containing protein n=1 Tax=Parashewanella hymeniacidonis TaxID=2807618 RepID=UPI001961D544|nr:DUF2878 domain-containing protein [Parashewanella hymeniacidonis]MBM7074235.1 DUF2878 domain-containing protein [Parashewanella hymeniacidonis]
MNKNFISLVCNGLLYNLMWLGCITYKSAFIPVVLMWVFWHLICRSTASERGLILFVVLMGGILDSVLMQLQVFQFEQESKLFVPLWLWAIWLSFSLTLFHALKALSKSVVLQIIVGAIFAPLAYFAGRELEAVQFGYSDRVTLIVLGLTWAVLLPSFFLVKRMLLELTEGTHEHFA